MIELAFVSCLVIGDSIAQGLAQAAPQCASAAQNGITSANWVQKFAASLPPSHTVVISLGTNDSIGTATEPALLKARASLAATNVIWILPSESLRPLARNQVYAVASRYGDYVVPVTADYLGPDKIHLHAKGYRRLMQWLFGK